MISKTLRLTAILLVLLLVYVRIVYADVYYPEWSTIYGDGDYSTLYAWGIEGDFYDELVYVTVQLNNTTNGDRVIGVVAYYVNGTIAWEYNIDLIGTAYVTGCSVDPTSDYLLVTGYFWDWLYTNTWDGVLIRINRTDANDWNGVIFHSGYHDFLRSVYVGGDGTVYAVGEYYNGSWYYGVIVRYNNYSFANGKWVGYTLSQYNLTFYDAVIGPDGYLYVTGHTLYRYYDSSTGNTYYIPVHQLVYKLDPVNLSIINTTYIYLPTSQGYVNIVNTMKVDIATCGDGICVAGFYYDEATGDPASPTLGAFVAKYDTSFNLLWRRNISTTEHEVFHGIAVDNAGNITVVGKTSNDYGSGLGNTYYHILDVVLDENGDLKNAFMAGGDNGDIAYDATVDLNGNIYLAGIQYSTTLTFYNITENITIASTPRLPEILQETPIEPAIKLPSTILTEAKEPSISIVREEQAEPPRTLSLKTVSETIKPTDTISVKANPPINTIITPQQTGTDDRALIASIGYYLNPNAIPPTPIPEPQIIVIIMAAIIAITYYYLRRVK